MAAIVGPVEVESGRVSGVLTGDGAVAAFKGVPYAAPPIGALRWKPPQPVAPWSGIRACEKFGPRCVQPDRPKNSLGYHGPEPESEDCLYLNIWTGAQSADERRPVMVWFHGGAYYIGSGSVPLFNGEFLAHSKGVVVVTINYRLGRLGFLAHPDLTQESDHGASGNYGLMDKIAALTWVRDNIAAFGGDPDRVTIFGQSVGSMSTSSMMASPLAKGLFHRVIGQSGGAFGPVRESSVTGDSIQSLEYAERSGVDFARALGAGSISDLRSKSAREIQLLWHEGVADPSRVGRGSFDTSWIIIDGHVLPDGPYTLFEQGKQNDVPLLTGSTANEGAVVPAAPSLDAYVAQTKEEFGPAAEQFFKLFPASNDEEAADASRVAFSFRNFVWQNWSWARLQTKTGRSKVFYYRFNHVPPVPAGKVYAENPAEKLGAFHGADIPYVFRNLAVEDWPWRPVDRALVETVSSYWTNFAAAGDPNGRDLPSWPAYDPKTEIAMTFAPETAAARIPDRAELDFWDAFYAGQRARFQGSAKR